LFVSPTLGDDALGAGTQSSPFMTITHALSVVVAPDTIQLLPGTYNDHSHEVFPLQVPGGVNLIDSTMRQAAVIQGPPPTANNNPVVEVLPWLGPGGPANAFAGFAIQAGGTGIGCEANVAGASAFIILSNLKLTGSTSFGARLTAKNSSTLGVFGDAIRAGSGSSGYGGAQGQTKNGIKFAASEGGAVKASVRGSRLWGQSSGLAVVAKTNGSVDVDLDMDVFLNSFTAGIVANSEPSGSIATHTTHSVFFNLGSPVIPAAAIFDFGTLSAITHDLQSCVFTQIPFDELPDYDAGRYSLSGNVYGANGSLPGGVLAPDPGFVDAPFDFHLLASAAARDVLASSTPDYPQGDITGDFPGVGASFSCYDGLLDAGMDEYRAFSLYSLDPLDIGQPATLRVLGPDVPAGPGPIAALLFLGIAGPVASPCPMSFELDLAAPLFFLGAANLDIVGRADFGLVVPLDPNLAGVAAHFQSILVDTNDLALGFSRRLDLTIEG
jgi:hypothetical protein